jgi:plasmid stabilization system protein ParE
LTAPRALRVRRAALDDLLRHERVLARERGAAFAHAWTDALLAWLTRLAAAGAQIGTAHAERPGMRTFGYRRQVTVLARFTDGELQVARLHFRGQDWQRPG